MDLLVSNKGGITRVFSADILTLTIEELELMGLEVEKDKTVKYEVSFNPVKGKGFYYKMLSGNPRPAMLSTTRNPKSGFVGVDVVYLTNEDVRLLGLPELDNTSEIKRFEVNFKRICEL